MKSLHPGKVSTARVGLRAAVGVGNPAQGQRRAVLGPEGHAEQFFSTQRVSCRRQVTLGWLSVEPTEAREKAIETHGQSKCFDANFSK